MTRRLCEGQEFVAAPGVADEVPVLTATVGTLFGEERKDDLALLLISQKCTRNQQRLRQTSCLCPPPFVRATC